jgi:ABC-type nitrate/sulfonate/bicarbonate transport system substrate-binding protein
MSSAKSSLRRGALIGAVAALSLLAAACSSSSKSSAGSSPSSGSSPAAGAASAPAAGSSAAPGASATMPKTMTTVKVGITGATAPPTFPPLIAQKLGIGEKNNIQIQLVSIAQNVTAQSLVKGSIDILAAPSVETAILQGSPLRIFAGAGLSYWHFVANSKITDWADLKGKKVALPCAQAATCHSFVVDLLKSKGVNADSITFIYGTGQGTYAALAAGSVDAALTTAPYTYTLASAGKTHELDITSAKPYLSTQFTATESYLKGHADVISAFVTSMQQAISQLETSPLPSNVLQTINDFGKANGIDPASLDEAKFLAEFATDKSWALVPTKALIQSDLDLLKAIPATAESAGKAGFDDLVYMIPQFEGQYG